LRKFINDPADVAAHTVAGFAAAYAGQIEQLSGTLTVVRRAVTEKVAVVCGGGSGHEPVWLEYIGPGFADAICQGDVFAAPPPPSIVQAARAVERGRGVLFMYGNYTGDRLNFDLAAEELEASGVPVRTVRIADDVAAAPPERSEERRGIAGGFFAIKIAGAAAASGLDLDAVYAVARRAASATRSIGVASAGGTIPGTDRPTFELPDGQMEVGMGMHGEAGVRRVDMIAADKTVESMTALLLADQPLSAGDAVAVLVNGLGATTRAELLIASRRLRQLLDEAQVQVHDFLVGNFATSQEMHGFSISLVRLDDELRGFYDAPGRTSFYAQVAA
jgi:dihydroxyacetone kinase-like protein